MIQVLIVEDSPVAAELVKYILNSDTDINVVGTAVSGDEALTFLDGNEVDVVTMDLCLPGMDGYQITREIMAKKPLPVVVVTASVGPERVRERFRAIDSGALAVLNKPVGLEDGNHEKEAEKLIQTVKDVYRVKTGFRPSGQW